MARRGAAALTAIAVLAVPAAADARYAGRTLATGSEGRDVKLLQRYLTRAGFRTAADGRYGTRTRKSVRRFERATRRRVDGRASRADQRLAQRAGRAGGTRGNGGARFGAAPVNPTAKAKIGRDGRTAVAPESAPAPVKNAIAAANRITTKPYRYGGGHGSFRDSGYDCSGAISYALHGGDLLDRPLNSTGFMSWGARGRGRWITVYAHGGHAYVVIAGLRFDTSGGGRGERGPRWRPEARSSRGFTARHPAGL